MSLSLNIGGWGSGTSAAFPGTQGTNAGVPQGPRTAAGAGFGTMVGGGGADAKTHVTLGLTAAALIVLGWIWWSLPR